MRAAPILFSVLLVLLSLSAPFFAEAGGGVVKGTVSSQNGIRLEGAKVEIEGVASTETDRTGHFLFSSVPAGFYKIEASKKGFPTINRALLVKPDRVQSLDFVLPEMAAPSSSSQMTTVPLMGHDNALFLRVQVPGGSEMTFLLDTGATYCALSARKANQLGVRPRPEDPRVTVTTGSGVLKAPLVLLPSLVVGGLEERDIETLIILNHPVPGDLEGILGLSFLNRFRFTIDPEASELILRR
jgi:clan AA aspartic protease (TIGR02281 family)